MSDPIETMNEHAVAISGEGEIMILLPPRRPMPKEEALRLAAWIVVLCQDEGMERLGQIIAAVCNT